LAYREKEVWPRSVKRGGESSGKYLRGEKGNTILRDHRIERKREIVDIAHCRRKGERSLGLRGGKWVQLFAHLRGGEKVLIRERGGGGLEIFFQLRESRISKKGAFAHFKRGGREKEELRKGKTVLRGKERWGQLKGGQEVEKGSLEYRHLYEGVQKEKTGEGWDLNLGTVRGKGKITSLLVYGRATRVDDKEVKVRGQKGKGGEFFMERSERKGNHGRR